MQKKSFPCISFNRIHPNFDLALLTQVEQKSNMFKYQKGSRLFGPLTSLIWLFC